MISVWNLLWICPLSALAGILLVVLIVVTDECLYWANEESDHFCETQSRYPPADRESRTLSKGGDSRDNTG